MNAAFRLTSPPLEAPLTPHEDREECDNEDVPRNDALEGCGLCLTDVEEGEDNERSRQWKSKNIPLTLAYTLLAFAGRSLWSNSVLSAFVYLLRNDNPEAVGLLTAIMGMSQLLLSFPAGFLADRHRRDALLKTASFVGVAAVSATSFAVWMESYQLLAVALAVWGVFWGISNTSLSALFADSVEDGARSDLFTQRNILVSIGSLTGPIVALVMFAILGDKWTTRDCAVVMGVGQVLCLPAVILLCFLSDDYAVVHHDEQPLRQPLLEEHGNDQSAVEEPQRCASPTNEEHMCWCIPKRRVVPVLCAVAEVMMGLAAGMSIRYFPIFFLDNLKLGPVMVQVLYALSPLGVAILSKLAQLGGGMIGRCQMTVALKWIGIFFMLTMIASYKLGLPVPVTCALYLLRTSFMNSTSALTKSVLMDAVPKEERGQWSALESVTMFSWSGSAALGGILVGLKGLIFNFYVTASLQFLATLPLIVLFDKVADEDSARESPSGVLSDAEKPSVNDDSESRSQTSVDVTDDDFETAESGAFLSNRSRGQH